MEGVGLIRALKFAKYLPEYGWEPLILTVNGPSEKKSSGLEVPEGIRVFRTEYRDVMGEVKKWFRFKKIHTDGKKNERTTGHTKPGIPSFAAEMLSMPDEHIGWYKFAVAQGAKVISEERVDAIFSTSPPETAHLVARRLKASSGRPWIADLRDLWSDDHFRKRSRLKRAILRFMERSVLKDADYLTTVSEPWARMLGSSTGRAKDAIKVIGNGYDEADFKDVPYARNDRLTISYTGKLHKKHQRISVFLDAVKGLLEEGLIDRNRLRLKFYVSGYDKPDIKTMAKSYDMSDVIMELDTVDYAKSLEVQRSSDALLLVQWQGEGKEGWYSAKVYDYLGARRPILALAEKGGIIEKLISRTSSGFVAYNADIMKRSLVALYDDFVKNGHVEYRGDERAISGCTRKTRTGELAELLDVACKRTQDRGSA